jgi:GDP-L-fucose synthase
LIEPLGTPLLFDLQGKRIYVAGHGGMAGAAIMQRLESEGCEILTADRAELDLTDQVQTQTWLLRNRPDAIFLAAGRVGGIYANVTFPADFLADNLAIALNVMRAAVAAKVKKLLYLGSSCVFPRNALQPMDDELLLTGPLEPTNEPYAIAKIAGIKLAQAYRRQFGFDFISVTPTNLYGSGDNYHPENSHVPAALIRRFHDAKICGAAPVSVWGTGTPKREFLAADDFGDACVFVMKYYSGENILNIGTGKEISIKDFAKLVADVVGYHGEIMFDTSRPDGAPRKLLDVSRLAALGWVSKTPLAEGLKATYADFLKSVSSRREC